jgi:glycosyltransferase involved in cell wall biosynthesis
LPDTRPKSLVAKVLVKAHRARALRFLVPGPVRRALASYLWRPAKFDIALSTHLKPGVALVGYPRAEIGLGEALRQVGAALEYAQVPFICFNIGQHIRSRQDDRRMINHISITLDRQVNLFVISPLYAGRSIRFLGHRALAGRLNILYAFWELPEWPEAWALSLAPFDQIWAPSRFVAEALHPKFHGVISTLPPPLSLPAVPLRQRSDFGLPAGVFLFYFHFDFASYVERKNPQAVVAAFRRCAELMKPVRVGLVFKTMGVGNSRTDRRYFAKLVTGAENIFWIDHVLGRSDMLALQSVCDCFVSLHRSEGFGLGTAEAMALGKPVIATNFGGTTDLLAPDRACPISYRPIPVELGQYPGGKGQFWADPNIEEAAAAMRRIAENSAYAQGLATHARAFIGEFCSPSRISKLMRQRLVGPA